MSASDSAAAKPETGRNAGEGAAGLSNRKPDRKFTISQVMSALPQSFPTPRTSRDCKIESRLQALLSKKGGV